MGDSYAGNIGSIISGSGSCEVIYTASSGDETAAFVDHINTAADEGTALFELYLDTSGSKSISFDGVVTTAEYTATVGELEIVTINFVTNGTITTALLIMPFYRGEQGTIKFDKDAGGAALSVRSQQCVHGH